MKISIITPTYNSESTITDTLISISNQTYTDIEHIVIDSLSSDATCQIVEENRPQSRCISERDSGLYDAMNKGIKSVEGEIVSILNSDDMYYDTAVLESVVNEFKKTNADILFGNIVYVNSENISDITRIWKTGPIRNILLWLGWIMPHPAVFVRRKVYDEIGLFDLKYKTSADYDFLLRVIYSGKYNIKFLDKFLVRMRTGGASDGSLFDRIKQWNITAQIFKKYYGIYPFWIFLTRPSLKILQFFVIK